MDAIGKLTRLSTILAFLLGVLISVGLPAGYFFLGYQNQRAVIGTEAQMNSIILSQAIGKSPEYWRYEERKLAEVLGHNTSRNFDELRSIVGADNAVIARTGGAVDPPLLTVSHNLFDSGNVVGRIEITTSLRPLLINTILTAIFGLFLGLAVFMILKHVPLRALSTALRSVYEEKEKAQAILDNIPDIAWLKDREGRLIAANGPFMRLCGVNSDDLPGKTDLDLWPRDLAEKYRADDRDVMETGRSKQMEEQISDTEGRRTWILTIKTPVFNNRDEIIGTTGIARDFTERKRMEEDLMEREGKLRILTQTAQDAIVMMDHEGTISFWNPAAEKIFGYTPTEALGKELHTFLAPQRYRETYRKGFAHFRETGHGDAVGKTLELDALRKGGEEFPIELSLSALQLKDNWHAVGIMRDITRRKSAEKSLKNESDFSRALIECMPGIFYLIDEKGMIQRWNRNIEETLGYSADEISSHSPLYFFSAQDKEIVNTKIQEVFSIGKAITEANLVSKNGLEIPYLLTGVRIEIDGSPYLVGIGMDISELKRAEEKIRKLNENLELEVRERTNQLIDAQEELVRKEKLSILGQLSGSVGHELRNPLGVMSNAVYFLKMVHADGDETTSEYLDMIKHEIDTSQRIITDLLDFARTKEPQTKTVTARQLLDESLVTCVIPENVELHTDLEDTLPLLRIDPLQMEQVFQNLITNAIQAMPEGGALRVAARRARSEELGERSTNEIALPLTPHPSQDLVEISVADTGEGISPENLKKLFQPLFTTKAKGIGLGLVVCRNLVEANGGSIWVESEWEKGTTFRVLLPAAAEQ